MQSRYYNAEWGRFINADGIVGQTGELLAHNLFAYSKNNPINMSDPSGFGPAFDNEVTQEKYDDWKWKQHQAQIQTKTTQSSTHRVLDSATNALGTNIGNGLAGIGDSGITQGIDRIAAKITKPSDYLFSNPKIAIVKGFAGKAGVLNSISFGLNVRDNALHYNTWDAVGRSIIDGIGFATTIGVAVWTAPLWAPNAAGFVVGTAAAVGAGFIVNKATGFAKDALFTRKRYE